MTEHLELLGTQSVCLQIGIDPVYKLNGTLSQIAGDSWQVIGDRITIRFGLESVFDITVSSVTPPKITITR